MPTFRELRDAAGDYMHTVRTLARDPVATLALIHYATGSSMVLLFAVLVPRYMQAILQVSPDKAANRSFLIDAKGNVVGLEALVRWPHPQRGYLLPAEFIGMAEANGLIRPLTSWVLRNAARQAAILSQHGYAIPVAINLCARSVQDASLVDEIAQLLQEFALSPERVLIEITEGAVMADQGNAVKVMRRIAALGVRFSMDDFGTGYSSLSYLQQLPVAELKIDKSFITNMLASDNDRVIVRSTIELGHNLGLTVVAEGVENQAVWDVLRELGCDVGQGFHLGSPLPEGSLLPWLESAAVRSETRQAATNKEAKFDDAATGT
mgnify:CR=1 FL=1